MSKMGAAMYIFKEGKSMLQVTKPSDSGHLQRNCPPLTQIYGLYAAALERATIVLS